MKGYKFIGNEKDLEELGYTNVMGLYWKMTSKCSIVITDNVAIKIGGELYMDIKSVKPHISDLIKKKLVETKNV